MMSVFVACLSVFSAGEQGKHGYCGQNGACQSGQGPWSVVNTFHKRCMGSSSGAGAVAPLAEEPAVPQLFREDEGLDNAEPVPFDACVNVPPIPPALPIIKAIFISFRLGRNLSCEANVLQRGRYKTQEMSYNLDGIALTEV